MANNSKDPNFLKALENANIRKANSGADYIRLFIEEYKKLNPNGRLAALFAATNERSRSTILIQVESELRKAAYDAFDNTFRVLRTRIDQFGVAQPNINPDNERDIITWNYQVSGQRKGAQLPYSLLPTCNSGKYIKTGRTGSCLDGH